MVELKRNTLSDAEVFPFLLRQVEENGHAKALALTWDEIDSLKAQLPACTCPHCREHGSKQR